MAHNPTPTRTTVQDAVERVNLELRELLARLAATPALPAGEIASTIAAVETAGRLMDAARVHAAAPLATEPGMPEQLGFTSPVAAVAALCGIKETSARARVRIATGISNDITIAGVPIPATHPRVGAALDAGDLGLDAASLIVTELGSVAGRVERDILDAAEAIMISRATGVPTDDSGERFASAVSVDFLATEVHQITAAIDPDGARPREVRSMRGRAFRLGQQNANGNFPVSGELTPEIGTLLAALMEAQRRSPRFTLITNEDIGDASEGVEGGLDDAESGAAQHDDRTPDQRRHDTFADIITRAAAAPEAPQLDGAPVLVIATAEDLDPVADDVFTPAGDPGDPIGIMTDSRIPVSRRTIERFIDAHGYRTATQTPSGRVTSISSKQRCFTPTQRLAIAARDGARCATLGCTTPHYMLQAHHVVPYRDGGATHVDNGILLCFWHHQQVDTGPWHYKMIGGIPHILGPGLYEWTARRPPTKRPQTRATLARTRASTPFSRGR